MEKPEKNKILFRQQREKYLKSKNGKKSENKKRNWNDFFFLFSSSLFLLFFAFNCSCSWNNTWNKARTPETTQHTRYERVEAVIETDFDEKYSNIIVHRDGRICDLCICMWLLKLQTDTVVSPSFDKNSYNLTYATYTFWLGYTLLIFEPHQKRNRKLCSRS